MKDKIFRLFLFIAALMILLLTDGIIYSLVNRSLEAFGEYGVWGFVSNAEWDPRSATEEYGALSFIMGTLYTAFFALFICIPFSLSVALFNGEYFKGPKFPPRSFRGRPLAGIPSIVYGFGAFIVCDLSL